VLPESKEIRPHRPSPDGPGTIRPFARGDFAEVEAILKESNLAFALSAIPTPEAVPGLGRVAVDVCERQGKISGILVWRNLVEEAEILDLAVAKRFRRQGNARFLLENFLRLGRERGIREVFLEVRESNAPAIELYRSFGFSATGRRPNYYRDPDEAALLLHLKITG
jgi:[ribosomal protein S18]-alanine N-acetyltransferase